jgi:hypothetical protein
MLKPGTEDVFYFEGMEIEHIVQRVEAIIDQYKHFDGPLEAPATEALEASATGDESDDDTPLMQLSRGTKRARSTEDSGVDLTSPTSKRQRFSPIDLDLEYDDDIHFPSYEDLETAALVYETNYDGDSDEVYSPARKPAPAPKRRGRPPKIDTALANDLGGWGPSSTPAAPTASPITARSAPKFSKAASPRTARSIPKTPKSAKRKATNPKANPVSPSDPNWEPIRYNGRPRPANMPYLPCPARWNPRSWYGLSYRAMQTIWEGRKLLVEMSETDDSDVVPITGMGEKDDLDYESELE